MFDDGFFGDLFDFNGDGELDSLEQSADLFAFMSMLEAEEDSDSDTDF